jgi:putative SOS response-associated peptidase YedK
MNHRTSGNVLLGRWLKQSSVLNSCAIIVTDANKLMKPIHDRMPVILAAEDFRAWLETDAERARELLPLLRPAPSAGREAYPLSKAVNSPRNAAVASRGYRANRAWA